MPGMWQTFQVCGDLGSAEPGFVDTLPHLGIVCYVNATDSTRTFLLSSSSQPGPESRAGSGLPTSHSVPGPASWVYLRACCQGASEKPSFRALSPKQRPRMFAEPRSMSRLGAGHWRVWGACHRDWSDRPLSLDASSD